jgi:hypothetical protein
MFVQPRKARGKLYRYYQCASRNHTAISADELEKLVEDQFLEASETSRSANVFGSRTTLGKQSCERPSRRSMSYPRRLAE